MKYLFVAITKDCLLSKKLVEQLEKLSSEGIQLVLAISPHVSEDVIGEIKTQLIHTSFLTTSDRFVDVYEGIRMYVEMELEPNSEWIVVTEEQVFSVKSIQYTEYLSRKDLRTMTKYLGD